MAEININRYTAHDGRRAEQRIVEKDTDAGHKERVVETHVEQIPLVLEERVVEKIVPIVTERRKEKYQGGKLVDTMIEQVTDESLHLSEPPKIVTKDEVAEVVRQALKEAAAQPQPSITKDDVVQVVMQAVKEATPETVVLQPKVVTREEITEAVKQAVKDHTPTVPMIEQPKTVTKDDVAEAVKQALQDRRRQRSVRATQEASAPAPVAPTTEVQPWYNEWLDLGLYITLSGELAFIAYQLFFRSFLERMF